MLTKWLKWKIHRKISIFVCGGTAPRAQVIPAGQEKGFTVQEVPASILSRKKGVTALSVLSGRSAACRVCITVSKSMNLIKAAGKDNRHRLAGIVFEPYRSC